METSFLKQYIELNKRLIKTLTIKSEVSADLVNFLIKSKYGADSVTDDKKSWKYYQNICGIYHSKDTPMYVISLDTLEEILFTKDNLLNHVATAEAYQYGTRYYYSLLQKYPEQEQLILGILYPADLNKAIDSEEGTILSYPKELVEFQERTLIDDLESYIKLYLGRWDVKAYGLTDDLYPAAQLAIMYLNLIPTLLNLRAKRCKTDEAHSFHIREYLASHYGLDNYLNYLTLKQAMYLYRNIRYIERNSGKTEQFKQLIDKLLTDRKIPITEYSVRQSKTFDYSYYPDIIVRKKGINLQYNKVETDYTDLDKVFAKERNIQSGNPIYLEENYNSITSSFKNSDSNAIQSKIIESDMVDYSESVPDTFESILMREWISHIDNRLYNVVVNFKDPKTFDVRNLYARDAFIYFQYIAIRSLDAIVYNVPDHFVFKCRKKVLPTIEQMLSIVDIKYKEVLRPIARRILDGQVTIDNCYSVSSFNDRAKAIYDESLYHWYLISNIHDMEMRAYVSNMVEQLYYAKRLKLEEGSMQVWLNSQNLPVYNFSFEEAQKLLQDIFIASTGMVINANATLANIQKAMMSIVEKLSSYSLQFITNINEDKIIPLNWAAIRATPKEIHLSSNSFCHSNIRVIEDSGSIETSQFIKTDTHSSEAQILEVELKDDVFVENKVYTTTFQPNTNQYNVYSSGYRISVEYPEYNENISSKAKFIGEEFLVNLTEASKKQIRSIY